MAGSHVPKTETPGDVGSPCLAGAFSFLEPVLLWLLCEVSFIFSSHTMTQNHGAEGWPLPLEMAHPHSACDPVPASECPGRPMPAGVIVTDEQANCRVLADAVAQGHSPHARLACISHFPRVLWPRLCLLASALLHGYFHVCPRLVARGVHGTPTMIPKV